MIELRPLPSRVSCRAPFTVLLTVIVPVFNEVCTIDRLLALVVAAPYEKQVIVVDDGSDDGTDVILKDWEGHVGFLLLRHAVNRGKGAAIRTALEKACGRFTIIQDADLETDPCDYPRLLEPLMNSHCKVVYGSRFLRAMAPGQLRWTWNRFGVSCLNTLVWLLYNVTLT